MALNPPPQVLAFDAYGTLFDVLSVSKRLEQFYPEQGRPMAQMLRDKQLEYSRLRALAGAAQYKSFWLITQDALRYTLRAFHQEVKASVVEVVMQAYAQISPYPEVPQALASLREAGIPLVVLSNGNPEMLAQALDHSGLSSSFDAVLSAESIRSFKVDPRIYSLALEHARCSPHEAVLVSSNAWDVAGARWQGLQAYWIQRVDLPFEELDTAPTGQGPSLAALADWVLKPEQ